MSDMTTLELIRRLWDYHWWANRRLLDEAVALGEEAGAREVGNQFSFTTLRRMFAHIYGADWIWLARWRGSSPTRLPGDEFKTMSELRQCWDVLEREQRDYLEAVRPIDLGNVVEWKNTSGQPFQLALGVLLHHVPNHATHHRSEVATMMTMISGSPPDTGIVTYELMRSGSRT